MNCIITFSIRLCICDSAVRTSHCATKIGVNLSIIPIQIIIIHNNVCICIKDKNIENANRCKWPKCAAGKLLKWHYVFPHFVHQNLDIETNKYECHCQCWRQREKKNVNATFSETTQRSNNDTVILLTFFDFNYTSIAYRSSTFFFSFSFGIVLSVAVHSRVIEAPARRSALYWN